MNIVHLLSTYMEGDAIGTYAREIHNICTKEGKNSKMYATHVHGDHDASIKEIHGSLFKEKKIDVLTYHMGTSDVQMSQLFLLTPAKKKVLFYHNITPAEYFEMYDPEVSFVQERAREELASLSEVTDTAVAMSPYSSEELHELGFKDISTIPLLIPEDPFVKEDSALSAELKENKALKILFFGRVVPHKCQHDLIKTVATYKECFDNDTELFIVGGTGVPLYEQQLKNMIKDLDVKKNIHLTGKATLEELGSYINNCDVFLSMSEHEGFFMPLIECMHHKLPIVAYKSAAIPYTLGEGGILFSQKDHLQVASLLQEFHNNSKVRSDILKGAEKQLQNYSYDVTKEKILNILCT